MALGGAALCKRAAKLELKESNVIRLDSTFALALEALLLDVYVILCPRPSDYEQRRKLVQALNKMAKKTFGSNSDFPIVEAFGSFVMDIFTARSDLDLSVNFSNDYTTEFPRDKKISVLRSFTKVLYTRQRSGHFSGVLPIMRARVPVVKVVDSRTGIECDISAENKDGISRSAIVTVVSSIDERFRILSYLMKAWAKAHDINSSKDRTMNSLSIISLVAFHLQTRDPPIFPPFSALLKDGADVSSIQNVVVGFKQFGRSNKESISELFVALLSKLSSVESLWQHGLCASTFEGSWIYKKWESGVGNISVEDFLDRSQNFARAVGKPEIQKIYKCIKGSLNHLSRFITGQIEAAKLKRRLFGSIALDIPRNHPISNQGVSLKRSSTLHESAPINPIAVKKARYTEATEELPPVIYETPTNLTNPSIPLHPPSVPLQSSNGVHLKPSHVPSQSGYGPKHHPQLPIAPVSDYAPHHLEPSYVPSQSGYWPQHQPQPPIAPDLGYAPQYYSQPPVAPHLIYGPQSHLQLPFTIQLGYASEHQPPTPVPYQFYYGSKQYQPDQNFMPPRNWDAHWSGYSNQGLGHPFVPPRQAYGPGYL